MFSVGIITVSDKGHAGEREDRSGPVIKEIIAQIHGEVVDYRIIPDEKEKIAKEIIRMVDQQHIDLILTTGGTGFSPRDLTPEATLEVIQRQVPGIPEVMRMKSLEITPMAMLSRGIAGIRKKSLIINLPGSPKGASENLEAILPALTHGLLILKGKTGECGSS